MKIKLCRKTTPEKRDMYEFKMTLFDNGNTKEFLFFIKKSKIALEASVTPAANARFLYLRIILRGERQN